MRVSVNRCCLVRPAEAAFRGCMPLAEFDQTGTLAHVPTIYFYRPPQSWVDAPSHTIFMALQTSLTKVLVCFYPLAGRLRWLPGARLELVCNDNGVELTEALADAVLDDLGDFSPSPRLHHLIPQVDCSSRPLEETPLMAVQVTRFKCGGITLSYCISHVVADGLSALHFISEWARMARGEPLGARPFLDRRVLRAGEPPSAHPGFKHPEFDPRPLMLGQSSNEGERGKETTTAMMKVSESMVEMLKAEANKGRGCSGGGDHTTKPYTRYEVISGHIWRCACKARRHAEEQPTALAICVDIRRRVQPPLPEKFFGNANMDVFAESLAGELVGRPLSYAAGRIREKIESVTSEYVHSTIDFLKNIRDYSKLQDIHAEGTFSGNPNISVISWIGLPLYGVDFGWGKEIFMGPGNHDGDGDALILPAYDHDKGLILAICLQTDFMDDFKKFFYQTNI